MKMKKSIIALSAAATLGLGSVLGIHATHAATVSSGTSIVDRLVSKFNLNRDEVQSVFAEDRQAHAAAHEQSMKERLAQAVTDKKLTQEQADLIISKQKEFQDYHDSLEDKPKTEERAALTSKMNETIQWAKDNNIPQEYLLLGPGGMRGHHGFKGERMDGEHLWAAK